MIIMKIHLSDNGVFRSIEDELNYMVKTVESNRKKIIRKEANIIQKCVENALPKSDLNSSVTNYDGTPYIHMQDDVKVTIKDNNAGNISAVIHGGKRTAYKWHLVNDGTSTTKATHFIEKALKESDSKGGSALDELINKIVK